MTTIIDLNVQFIINIQDGRLNGFSCLRITVGPDEDRDHLTILIQHLLDHLDSRFLQVRGRLNNFTVDDAEEIIFLDLLTVNLDRKSVV